MLRNTRVNMEMGNKAWIWIIYSYLPQNRSWMIGDAFH